LLYSIDPKQILALTLFESRQMQTALRQQASEGDVLNGVGAVAVALVFCGNKACPLARR
jgi:hypothetical protein